MAQWADDFVTNPAGSPAHAQKGIGQETWDAFRNYRAATGSSLTIAVCYDTAGKDAFLRKLILGAGLASRLCCLWRA
jgi:hypothetical protein